MKYFDNEEKELAESVERGEWKPVKNQSQEIKKAIEMARNTLKRKNINLRVSTPDLQMLKTRAEERGIPYQTIVGALIRQYTRGQIKLEI